MGMNSYKINLVGVLDEVSLAIEYRFENIIIED
jgi:hypothetical protein